MGCLSALEVFPTLRRLPGFQPRIPRKVPIGFRPRPGFLKALRHAKKTPQQGEKIAVAGLTTLYHDLGVLAFDGCNTTQIEQIGTILQRVMAWGGVDGLHVALKEPITLAADVPSDFSVDVLQSDSNRDQYKEYISGQIALDGMMSLHEWAVANNALWGAIDPTTKHKIMRNKLHIEVQTFALRRGIYLETDTGTRRLPLRTRTVFKASGTNERVHTETWISTRGKGDIVGSFQARYQTSQSPRSGSQSDNKGFAARVWDHKQAGQREQAMLAEKSPHQTNALQAAFGVLEILWKLERETWAERSNVITEEDRKAEAQQAANAGKRGPLKPVDVNASQSSKISRNQDGAEGKKRQWLKKRPAKGRNKMNPPPTDTLSEPTRGGS